MICFYVNCNDAHTILTPPPFVAILLFQDIIIATIELCEGGGVVIRGGRRTVLDEPPLAFDRTVVDTAMPTPSMRRR